MQQSGPDISVTRQFRTDSHLVSFIIIIIIISEQTQTPLLQQLQGAGATRAAAAATRSEPGNTARAFTAERDLVGACAGEHTELSTAAYWRELEAPAGTVRCAEQA